MSWLSHQSRRNAVASARLDKRNLRVAAAIAACALASPAFGQIAYVTTENRATPVGVFYRDNGQWLYAGAFPGAASAGQANGIDAAYGIVRNGGDLYVTESSTGSPTLNAGRLLKVGANGSGLTTLLTAGSGNAIKGNMQGEVIGPDGKLYFGTAFAGGVGSAGGPSGIWRVNLDGSGLENIVPTSAFTSNNYNIRDLAIGDLDGDPSNGFDVWFGTRNGFADTGRPIFHATINGSTLGPVETLTTTALSPVSEYYDAASGRLYYVRSSGSTYQVGYLNPTGTGQTPTPLFNAGDGIDLVKIGSDLVAVGTTGEVRYVSGAGAPGDLYTNFNTISSGVINAARQVAVVDASELPTATFNGAGTNNNFSAAGNFVGGTGPNLSQVGGFAPRITFTASSRTNITNDVSGGARVGNLAFDASAPAYTISGNPISIDFAGGITNLSSNTQTFNTDINVGGGSFAAINGGLVLNGTVTTASGGLLTLSGAGNITFNGKLSGGGSIDKSNTGSLVLANAANDFTGTLSINRGALVIDSVAAQSGLGAPTSTLSAGGAALDGVIKLANNVNVSRTILLPGRSAQPAPAPANSFFPQVQATGGTDTIGTVGLTGGNTTSVVQADAGATLNINAVENRAASNGAAALRVQGAGNATIGTIGGGTSSGTLSLIKAGAGTLNLSNVTWGTVSGLTNGGSVTVQGGTVIVNAPTPSSAARPTLIQVDAGATFDASSLGVYTANIGQGISGSGTLKGNFEFYDDVAVRPGDTSDGGRVGTLNVSGSLVLQDASNTAAPGGLNFDIAGSSGAASDRIAVSGDLALNGTAGPVNFNIFSLNGTYAAGSYRLIDYGGTLAVANAALRLTGGSANYRQGFSIDTSTPGQVNMIVMGSAKTLAWHGDGTAGGAKFDVGTTADFRDGGTPSTFLLGDTVQFTDDATADGTAILQSPIIGRVEVNAARDYTIKNIADYDTTTAGNQPSGFTEGTTVVKSGTGTLTIDSTGGLFPNWTGQLVVSGGVVNAVGALGGIAGLPFGVGIGGQAATVLDGGTLRFAATAAGSSSRTFTLTSNGGTIETNIGESLGTTGLPVLTTGAGNRTLTLTGTAGLTFGGIISDPAGGGVVNIVKNGTAASVLSNAQAYGGTLTINSGRLQINNVAGVGTSAGGTVVNDTGALYIVPAATGTYNSAESFSIAGTGAKIGAAAQETTGALRLAGANQLTTSGNLMLMANANLGVDDLSGAFTVAGAVGGTGNLTKVGAGTLGIGNGTAGTLNLNGGINVSAGLVSINTPAATAGRVTGLTLATGTSIDLNRSKLVVDYSDASTFADLNAAVVSGRAGGAWTGTGVRSSFVAANPTRYAVALVEASSVLPTGTSTYFGQTVDDSSLILAVTLRGDADISGSVNFSDLLALARNYGGTGKTWATGDSDYNGTVDFADLLALARNYGGTFTASQASAEFGSAFAGDWALAQSLAPEPASMAALLGLGGLVAARRRRA